MTPGNMPHFEKKVAPAPLLVNCVHCGKSFPEDRIADHERRCKDNPVVIAEKEAKAAKEKATPKAVKRLSASVLADAVLAEPKSHTGIAELQRIIRRNGKTNTSEMNAVLDVIARLRADGYEF